MPTEISISTTDTYAMARQKITAAWPHLSLQIHHPTAKFWKEGYDDFDDDAHFIAGTPSTDPLFILTGATRVKEALRLLKLHTGGEVYISHPTAMVQLGETMDSSNDPFILRFDHGDYHSCQKAFHAHWNNLTLKLCDIKDNYRELPPGFDTKVFNYAPTFMHDYTYIFDWKKTLERLGIYGVVHNIALDIDWPVKVKADKIKDFQLLVK